MEKPKKKPTQTSKGGKKPKMWDVVFKGEPTRMVACPHRCRLVVVKNENERKGFLILRAEDGALVCWARLKGDATGVMALLEDILDVSKGELQEKTVLYYRKHLAEL